MTPNDKPSKPTGTKQPRGRPVKYPLPEPIPDTPANIMKAFIKTPPKKRGEWKFVQKQDKKQAP